MREILFRGKRLDNGEWIEGGYYHEDYTEFRFITFWNSYGLGFMDSCRVAPATVGQYTGRKDKNGRKIFEGDIIRIPGSNKKGLPAQVWYNPYDAFFEIRRMGYNPLVLGTSEEWAEVIGNIHDNPELLGVEE